ncbi:MAG: hypothetical protein QXW12_02695 [Nitrososphaerota archaeon]
MLHEYEISELEAKGERRKFCPVCRGKLSECRPAICPFVKKLSAWIPIERFQDRLVFGASPPTVLVGEWGYPKVNVGPAVSAMEKNFVGLLDMYEKWLDFSMDELLLMRLSLLHGKKKVGVTSARTPNKLLESFQELAMSSTPVDAEMEFESKPSLKPLFYVREPPIGPSAPLLKVRLVENPSVPRTVEKVVADTDLRAADAIITMYRSGIRQEHITRLLSIGLLGAKNERKVVPTEWSITAVDEIIGKSLRKEVMKNPLIDLYEIYGFEALYNRVYILLLPLRWMFEVLEYWHNMPSRLPYSDHEFPGFPDRYPENIGGAYHAVRLPVLEHLSARKRQAAALVFIEVFPGWLPLGVWRLREISRRALSMRSTRASSLDEALSLLSTKLKLPIEKWIRASWLLDFLKNQTRLE